MARPRHLRHLAYGRLATKSHCEDPVRAGCRIWDAVRRDLGYSTGVVVQFLGKDGLIQTVRVVWDDDRSTRVAVAALHYDDRREAWVMRG